ncbi:MAG: hypothetical protein ACTSYE_05510 [Alphaproteobacteria bacterium]
MARVKDLGPRIELLPEDRFFHDISIALHMQHEDGEPRYLVHSYAPYEGMAARIAYITKELQRLGGLERIPGGGKLRFPCGGDHQTALRRLFTRVCRRDPSLPGAEFSLTAYDKKAECDIVVSSTGNGHYRVAASLDTPMANRRIGAARNGLVKLAQMIAPDTTDDLAEFTCGMAHDELVAALLPDALNVRGAVREQDALRGGGVLSSPGRTE